MVRRKSTDFSRPQLESSGGGLGGDAIELREAAAARDRTDQSQPTAPNRTTSSEGAEENLARVRHDRIGLRIKKWWIANVAVVPPHGTDIRDFLALERTYLAHLHTATALSMIGVTVAQLYLLSAASARPYQYGTKTVGKGLSCGLVVIGIIHAMIGGIRYFRQQAALVRSRFIAGGFDNWSVAVLFALFTLALFVTALVGA